MVEEGCPDVVQMSEEGKDALLLLVVPDFDLVIVTAGDKERLILMEGDSSDWTVVLIEFLDHCRHAVVPELDDTAVKRGQDPWSLVVE